MTPFADDSATTTIADLTAENGKTAVTLSGDLRIGRDQEGLRYARELKRLIDAVVGELEKAGNLPAKVADDSKPSDEVANPFA